MIAQDNKRRRRSENGAETTGSDPNRSRSSPEIDAEETRSLMLKLMGADLGRFFSIFGNDGGLFRKKCLVLRLSPNLNRCCLCGSACYALANCTRTSLSHVSFRSSVLLAPFVDGLLPRLSDRLLPSSAACLLCTKIIDADNLLL